MSLKISMEKLNLDETKKIQLEILNYVDAFCKDNHIHYWIDSGTLLGAVRHKGYIPWDDDIDLGMLREDYDRFIEMFNTGDSKYRIFCFENDPTFPYFWGKIMDTSTVLYEPDKNGYKLSINIDLFVYDNAPDNGLILKMMYFTRDLWSMLAGFHKFERIHEKDNPLRRLIKKLLHKICSAFPQKFFVKNGIRNSKRYSLSNTQRVGNFTCFTKMVCNKSVFNDFIDIEFEKNFYKAPIGYDEWLRAFYGNYMELPPVEKRVSNHKFEAYKKGANE